MAYPPRSPLSSRPGARSLRRKRWQQVSWWYSSIFAAAILLLATTVAVSPGGGAGTNGTSVTGGVPAAPSLTPTSAEIAAARTVTFTVRDQQTGAPLAGAMVSVGGQMLTTGPDGTVQLPVTSSAQEVVVTKDGYGLVKGIVPENVGAQLEVGLTLEPTPTPVPPAPTPGTMAIGTVLDDEGAPIEGATVRIGSKITETNDSGEFSLEYDGQSTEAWIFAPGYADRMMTVTSPMTVQLVRFTVKGVYLFGMNAGDPAIVDSILDMVDRTELNTIVLDTKDGVIFYDSKVQFYVDAGLVRPTYNVEELVRKIKDRGIYLIARQVAFKDPLVAEAHPEMAIIDTSTGDLWRGWGDSGEAWVNALNPGLYQPNVDLAVESIKLGFDEIQYDYIRFPDGSLKNADLGPNYASEEKRIAALTTQLAMTREALRPLNGKLSADIFGWMLLVPDDQGIGQRFEEIVAEVDYVSPMVYPSHFPNGSLATETHPNNHPYETIEIAMYLGIERMGNQSLKMRPWLQDFGLPGQKDYNSYDVREQINAAQDSGASGWLIWNQITVYHDGAYILEGESEWSPPVDEQPIPPVVREMDRPRRTV